MKSIAEIAASDGRFATLVAAAGAAGLADALAGEGPFTVFAPTDEAFGSLPEGTIETLLANPEQLRQILLYHVAPGRLLSADVAGLGEIATAQGGALKVKSEGDSVLVGGARVLIADIEAANGVIHVIDRVLLP